MLTSTGSWPDILPNGYKSPWPVRTSWYCGIVLSLFSILTAANQTVRLYRMSAHRDAGSRLRRLLQKNPPRTRDRSCSPSLGDRRPSTAQMYAWQLPAMFLTTATLCMIVGMFLHVWSATRHLEGSGLWDPSFKVALTFTIVAAVSIAIFFAAQATLYAPDDDSDSWE